MKNLTEKQRNVLEFISNCLSERGTVPTVREVAAHFGITIGPAQRYLKTLEHKGYLRHTPGAARGIDLTFRKSLVAVPVLGSIHAGMPLEQYEVADDYVYVDRSVTVEGNHFALKVKGDSMINAGIFDGDTVVVRMQSSARHNDIVAAMIDGEATLKRLKKNADQVYLQAENPAYPPIRAPHIEILGVAVYLVRKI
jgi:repressor LexA